MSVSRALPLMRVLRLGECAVPLYDQLVLEEYLLRHTRDNWCLVNRASSVGVVMGIGGRLNELVNIPAVQRDRVKVIRRFTGGGTVVVDENTLLVSFICNNAGHFALRENDYVVGDHKIGGNAQGIVRGRWVHHTSFLHDFDAARMGYLTLPARRPEYRRARPHGEFLRPLRALAPLCGPDAFLERVVAAAGGGFELVPVSATEALADSMLAQDFEPRTAWVHTG